MIALTTLVCSTFAWYIYNTAAHTTKVQLAVGSSVSLLISDAYNGEYSNSAALSSFTGRLTPVSTNNIRGGFQKVKGFETVTSGSTTKSLASVFTSAASSDYYMTSLYIKSVGGDSAVYVSDIGYEDSDTTKPISTAIRVGLLVHEQGNSTTINDQFIFEINRASNPNKEYNTKTGSEGYVLDSSKTDGSTVAFTPYNSNNFAEYDNSNGVVTVTSSSQKIADIKASDSEPVQVDVYIWLEGCDEDCTGSIANMTLRNLSISFAGV